MIKSGLFTRVTVVLMLSMFSSLWAQDDAAMMEVEDCVQIALQNNSMLKKANYTLESAEYDVLSSYKGILPSISASANDGTVEVGASEFLSDEPVGIDPETGNVIYEQRTRTIDKTSRKSSSANLTLRQNIFDGGIWWNQIKKSKIDEKTATHNLHSEINNTVLSVQSAYYDLIKQKKLDEANEMAVQKSEAQLARTEKMYELGATARIDVYRAKVNLGNDRIQALTQKNIVIQARKNLNIAMGRDPLTPLNIHLKDVSLVALPDSDELVSRALKQQPQVQQYKEDIESKKLSISMAKGLNYPSVSAYVNYNRSHEDILKVYTDFEKNYQYSYGLSLNFNLFNGFSDYSNIEKAVLAKKSSEESFLEYKRTIISTIDQYNKDYSSYIDIIEINEENLKAAQEEVRLAEERYQVGAGTSLEVRESHVNLTRAEQTLIAAQYNAMLLLAQIEGQLGIAYTKWAVK